MDAVYVIGKACNVPDFWELRMSLRSLHKNFKDLGRVYVVGHKPQWCQNVIHIPHHDPYKSNKDANLIQKLVSACFHPDLSQEFIWFSDDQFLVSPVNAQDVKPARYNDSMLKNNKSKWMKRAHGTVKILKSRGLPTHIFECHCPYVIDKTLYPQSVLQYDYGVTPGYLVNTLYFNTIKAEGHTNNTVCSAGPGYDGAQMDNICSGRLFLNINHGYNEKMIAWMENRFPEKSPYEV
jgi:hypothetical protein